MTRDEIAARLRDGKLVTDFQFDRNLPSYLRHASPRHWTPVGIAVRVAAWLQSQGARRVLDVGSGAGKFCVVGALSSKLSFTGVEQRVDLSEAARLLAMRFGVDQRVEFTRGEPDAGSVGDFDALYFYNPFGENLLPWKERLDQSVELSLARYRRDVANAERLLGSVAVGSLMVTHNGFGGRVPDSFDLLAGKMAGRNMLRLWRKAREVTTGAYWSELEDVTPLRPALRADSGWFRVGALESPKPRS